MPANTPHNISTSTQLLGVAGWPVKHSLSPAIQNAALRAANLDYIYLAFPIEPQRFETAVRGMAAAGMTGLNCTVPHKYAALAICDELSEEARLVGAANTLHFLDQGHRIHGSNTDVEGYIETLRQDAGFDFSGKTVVQIGTGGAGRGMALGALQAGTGHLILANRTATKAEALANDLLKLHPNAHITVVSTEEDPNLLRTILPKAQLVTNATSLGLAEGDPFPCAVEDIAEGTLVFDAAYTAQRSTAWLRAAKRCGLPTLDGLGMLVRQGAASFRIWTGIQPDLEAMFAALPKKND